jgi:hypothetical protein
MGLQKKKKKEKEKNLCSNESIRTVGILLGKGSRR